MVLLHLQLVLVKIFLKLVYFTTYVTGIGINILKVYKTGVGINTHVKRLQLINIYQKYCNIIY